MDMKVFAKLLLEHMRSILLLRYAPLMEAQIKERFSEENFKYLQEVAKNKNTNINSAALKEMLSAYDAIGYSYLPQLPLELALLAIIGGTQKTTQ